jgi:hypothetical protein
MSQQRSQRGRTIRSDIRINIPPTQEGLVVSVFTWNGLIERIKGLKPDFRPWSIAYSTLFGIAITSGLSIAPLNQSDAPTWLLATYASACATTFLLGVGFFFMERQLSNHQRTHVAQLVNEMDQIRDESLNGGSA